MGKRSAPLAFDSSRIGLDSDADVRVGAYARRQLRRRILLGLLGLVLIAGAVWLYCRLRPPRAAGAGGDYLVQVQCLSCGHTETLRVPPAQTFPMKCPRCKELACQPLWQCRDCGERFVPEQTGGVVHCPKCGSERVGSATQP